MEEKNTVYSGHLDLLCPDSFIFLWSEYSKFQKPESNLLFNLLLSFFFFPPSFPFPLFLSAKRFSSRKKKKEMQLHLWLI